jgi:ATP-dependent RNA helicase SUPV3L1/SUV3
MIAILKAAASGQDYPLAPEGAGSFALDGTWPDPALWANGYLRFGRRAVRADLAERLGWEIARRRKDAGRNAFALPIDLASMISCPADDWPGILRGYGLAPAEKNKETGSVTLWRYGSRTNPGETPPAASAGDTKGHARAAAGPTRRRPGPDRTESPSPKSRPGNSPRPVDPDSPFAALAALLPQAAPSRPPKAERKKRPRPAPSAEIPSERQQGSSFIYTPFT